jgi:hypothetical protein
MEISDKAAEERKFTATLATVKELDSASITALGGS